MLEKPGVLLRAEGLVILAVSLSLYYHVGGNWKVLLLLLFSPDLFMLGYLANAKVGASVYNLVHCEVLPLLLGASAVALHHPEFTPFTLIWLAHIGFDRALGYGLKYPTFFRDTHFQHVQNGIGHPLATSAEFPLPVRN